MADSFETLVEKLNENNLWTGSLSLKRNEYLSVKGSKENNLYFVEEGSLRIFMIDELEEHTIRFGYKNSIITALDSFINEKPSNFYIQAIRKSELKYIDKKSYMEFLNNDIENIRLWHSILEGMILQLMEREVDILTSSPQERYRRVFERSPQLFQEIPNKYIAAYLRMTPETLSRIKKS